jgi:hypothetical protein
MLGVIQTEAETMQVYLVTFNFETKMESVSPSTKNLDLIVSGSHKRHPRFSRATPGLLRVISLAPPLVLMSKPQSRDTNDESSDHWVFRNMMPTLPISTPAIGREHVAFCLSNPRN